MIKSGFDYLILIFKKDSFIYLIEGGRESKQRGGVEGEEESLKHGAQLGAQHRA